MTLLAKIRAPMKTGLIVGTIIVGAAVYGMTSGGAAAAPGDPPPETPAARPSNPHQGAIMSGESLPPGHPPVAGMSATRASESGAAIQGTVVEVIPAGQYSYLRFSIAGAETWAAVEGAVAVGAHVEIVNATAMDGFTSPTLGRKFDRIFFGVARPLAGQ